MRCATLIFVCVSQGTYSTFEEDIDAMDANLNGNVNVDVDVDEDVDVDMNGKANVNLDVDVDDVRDYSIPSVRHLSPSTSTSTSTSISASTAASRDDRHGFGDMIFQNLCAPELPATRVPHQHQNQSHQHQHLYLQTEVKDRYQETSV